MTNTEMILILEVADGTISASRIKRIIEAKYNVLIEAKKIYQVCQENNICTPKGVPSNQYASYPDKWSILLEAKTFWIRVRRYWGDNSTCDLERAIQLSDRSNWLGLYSQFGSYTTSAIHDRRNINLELTLIEQNEPEKLGYSWDLQRDLYLEACEQIFFINPVHQQGVKYPLPTKEWEQEKQAKFNQACLDKANKIFPDDQSVILFFNQFWETVKKNRGVDYYNQLRYLVHGNSESLQTTHWYTANDTSLRRFLRNLEGFKTKSPYRIFSEPYDSCALKMDLEGLILRYGWQKLRSLICLSVLG